MSDSHTIMNYVELPAVGLDETKAFYQQAFGFTWIDYGPTYAGYSGPNVECGLSTEATPAPAHEPGAESAIGPLILFGTDNLDHALNQVTAAGGAIVSGPYGYPGGRRFHFRDPSGNILGVYQSDAE